MSSKRLIILKDGSKEYEIRVFKGRDTITGKQLPPYTTRFKPEPEWTAKRAEKEAEKFATLFEAECKAGKVMTKQEQLAAKRNQAVKEMGKPTFKKCADQFITKLENEGKAIGTLSAYQIAFNRAERFNDMLMEDITKSMMQDYFTELQTKSGNKLSGKPLAINTLKKEFGFIKNFFNRAEDDGIIESSPMVKMKTPQRKKTDIEKEGKAYTLEEVQYIIDCVMQEPPKWKAFFLFMIDTGCRRGEVCGLEWSKINFETGVVTIDQQVQYDSKKGQFSNGAYVTVPKTKNSKRTVRIRQETMKALKEWKKLQAEIKMELNLHRNDFVFTEDKTGEPLQVMLATARATILRKKYNIPEFHLHALRHSHATMLILEGNDPVTVCKLMGHSNPNITMGVYAHTFQQAKDEAINKHLENLDRGRKAN